MMKYIFFFSFALFITSCFENRDNKITLNQEATNNKNTINLDSADRIIHAKVQGMTCVMGCGGSIRKNLKLDCSVSKVEFDFIDGADDQICRIHYNSLLTSELEIKKKVESINDGQFEIVIDSTSNFN